MDTNLLADFQALARVLNFSRAAELRHITQPAFGRRIRALEEWCGSTLIDRSTHRLKLTPAGKIMLETAADVMRRLERVQQELELVRAATATLTFAATHALSFIFFPQWVQKLGAAVSTMPIRLLSDNMNECERIMLSRRAQFLLCHHHPHSRINLPVTEFQHIGLAQDRLIPISAKDHGGQPLHRLPGSAAAPVPAIMFEQTSGMGRILQSNLFDRTTELHLTPVFSSHLAMVLKALATDGKGVAWVPESLVSTDIGPQGPLILAGTKDWTAEVQISLFRPRIRMSEMAEEFWELACREAQTIPEVAANRLAPGSDHAGNQ